MAKINVNTTVIAAIAVQIAKGFHEATAKLNVAMARTEEAITIE
jgi:hypothetical protein